MVYFVIPELGDSYFHGVSVPAGLGEEVGLIQKRI
jgi:hypothetical protein